MPLSSWNDFLRVRSLAEKREEMMTYCNLTGELHTLQALWQFQAARFPLQNIRILSAADDYKIALIIPFELES